VYDIEDRGAVSCPNGRPGHALHFRSRERNELHQLSDVVIELSSARFCVITFLARGAGSVVTSGSFEQHYADVDGYWVQTDGVIDGTWQSSPLSRKRHGVWRYRLVDVSFPTTLPNDVFAASAPHPGREAKAEGPSKRSAGSSGIYGVGGFRESSVLGRRRLGVPRGLLGRRSDARPIQ
jgi:hypothetical protein